MAQETNREASSCGRLLTVPGPGSLAKCAAGALLLAACSAGGPSAGQAASLEETVASPAPPPEDPPDRDCSASRMMLKIGEQDLPEPVSRMRHRLVVSALTCDFDELGSLAAAGADENSDLFLGGGESESPARWRELERTGKDEPLANLIRILSLDPGTVEVDDGSAETVYVWPAAATEAPLREDWAAMTSVFDAGLVEQLRRRSERTGLGYLGWKVAINSSGDWVHYVLTERD